MNNFLRYFIIGINICLFGCNRNAHIVSFADNQSIDGNICGVTPSESVVHRDDSEGKKHASSICHLNATAAEMAYMNFGFDTCGRKINGGIVRIGNVNCKVDDIPLAEGRYWLMINHKEHSAEIMQYNPGESLDYVVYPLLEIDSDLSPKKLSNTSIIDIQSYE